MNIDRLHQISYAEGFIEDFIDKQLDNVEPDSSAYAAQVEAMWDTLTAGLKELRLENLSLQARLQNVISILQGSD